MQLAVPPEAGHDVGVPPKATDTEVSVDGNPEAETDTDAPAGPDVGERVMDKLGEVTAKVVVATPRLGSVTVSVYGPGGRFGTVKRQERVPTATTEPGPATEQVEVDCAERGITLALPRVAWT